MCICIALHSVIRCKPTVEVTPNTPQDKNVVSTLPQCTAPNQRIHIDLFGPLKNSENGNNYILGITDAFTKYVILTALPDKEAPTVAKAFFEQYICQFSVPTMVLSDQGKEFCNKLFKELSQILQFKHKTTSAYHPQCNAQAEIANKTIAKYLSSFVNENTTNWEDFIFPLMLSYNTSSHSATKFTPFALTFAAEPRIPPFETPQTNKYYGDSLHIPQNICKQKCTPSNANMVLISQLYTVEKKCQLTSTPPPGWLELKSRKGAEQGYTTIKEMAKHWYGAIPPSSKGLTSPLPLQRSSTSRLLNP